MISTVLNDRQDEPFSNPKERTTKIHIEKIISLIPLPYYQGWLLLASFFLLISCLILTQIEKSLEYIHVFIIISAVIALEGTAINWSIIRLDSFDEILINIIDLPEETITKLYKEQKVGIFDDKRMIAFSIIFIAFVHASGIDYHAVIFNSNISELALVIGYYFAVYIMGVGLYMMAMTAQTVNKIGTLPLRVNALYSDFHAVGILYSKFTILAASVYIVWGFFHMTVPPRFSSLQIILWFLAFAILLFTYFILPQYNIHRMMASTKKEKIEMFTSQLRAALDRPVGSPFDESARHLRDMLSVQNRLDQMSEWPFGIYDMLYVLLVIIIPLIVVLLEIKLGVIK